VVSCHARRKAVDPERSEQGGLGRLAMSTATRSKKTVTPTVIGRPRGPNCPPRPTERSRDLQVTNLERFLFCRRRAIRSDMAAESRMISSNAGPAVMPIHRLRSPHLRQIPMTPAPNEAAKASANDPTAPPPSAETTVQIMTLINARDHIKPLHRSRRFRSHSFTYRENALKLARALVDDTS